MQSRPSKLPSTPLRFFVYILRSELPSTARTYVGWTTNIDLRLAKHNTGSGAKATRGRKWVLVYAERYKTRHDAMSREWHLKRDRVFRRNFVIAGAMGIEPATTLVG